MSLVEGRSQRAEEKGSDEIRNGQGDDMMMVETVVVVAVADGATNDDADEDN